MNREALRAAFGAALASMAVWLFVAALLWPHVYWLFLFGCVVFALLALVVFARRPQPALIVTYELNRRGPSVYVTRVWTEPAPGPIAAQFLACLDRSGSTVADRAHHDTARLFTDKPVADLS